MRMLDITRVVSALLAAWILGRSSAVCPAGFIYPDCQQPCDPGFFGVNCSNPCPTTCANRSCQSDTGMCFGCQIGFTGLNCSFKCQQGFFGQNCSSACPPRCHNDLCDAETGFCDSCLWGFHGVRCEDELPPPKLGTRSETGEVIDDQADVEARSRFTEILIYSFIGSASCLGLACVATWCICHMKVNDSRQGMCRDKTPIYRKVSPESSYCVLGCPGKEPRELPNISEEVDSAHDDDDGRNLTVDGTFQNKESVSAGKSTDHLELNSKHVPADKMAEGVPKCLPAAVGKNESATAQEGYIDTPELKKILKENAPLSLKRAANFSRDLFFKTYLSGKNVDLGTEVRVDEEMELRRGLQTSSLQKDQASGLTTDEEERENNIISDDRGLHVDGYSDDCSYDQVPEGSRKGWRSFTSDVGKIFIICKTESVSKVRSQWSRLSKVNVTCIFIYRTLKTKI